MDSVGRQRRARRGAVAPGLFVLALIAVAGASLLLITSLPGARSRDDDGTEASVAFRQGLTTVDLAFGTSLSSVLGDSAGTNVRVTTVASDNPLLLTLEALVADSGLSAVAISVLDLDSGERYSYRGDVLQRSGCVINFFALLLALSDVQDGLRDLSSVEWNITDVLGYSDAAAAYVLYEDLGDGDVFYGMERVEAFMYDTFGLYDAVLDHPPGYEWDTRGLDSNNWVTADTMTMALAMLYRGEILAEPWREYFLERMTEVRPGLNYLLATLPPSALVAHKNGWFDYEEGLVENDTAIIRFEVAGQQRAYAITYLSDSPDMWQSIQLGQAVTNAVYAYFGGGYPADDDVPAAGSVEQDETYVDVPAVPEPVAEEPPVTVIEPPSNEIAEDLGEAAA